MKLQLHKRKDECQRDYEFRKSYIQRIVAPRISMYDDDVHNKNANYLPISRTQKRYIRRYWQRYIKHFANFNFAYYDVYNKVCKNKSQLQYYIPDPLFYGVIDEYFTNPVRSTPIDDKNYYDLLLQGYNLPETICRSISNRYTDKDFNTISELDFVERIRQAGQVVVKLCYSTYGGHDVFFFDPTTDDIKDLLQYVHTDRRKFPYQRPFNQYIVQKAIRQHENMAAFNSSSVNTIRIMTLERNGVIHNLSSVLRIGINGSRVDNCSSGGIVVGIDCNGITKSLAYDQKANEYTCHPDGQAFANKQIPSYDKVLQLVTELATRFAAYSRLISWDIAIEEYGTPVVIEMNISYGELDFHQMCNGAIFGDMTDEILKEVKENSFTFNSIYND